MELAISTITSNSLEYKKQKAEEFAKISYKFQANTISIKSMVGDLDVDTSQEWASILQKVFSKQYALEINKQRSTKKKFLTNIALVVPRDHYQGRAANRPPQTNHMVLSALKIINNIAKNLSNINRIS